MKRRDFMKLGAGLGAAGLAGGLPFEANAQTKAVFKASDVQPPGYPTVAATENLGKKLSEATQGRLSIQMYPSMQLGGEKETIEQTQIGAIQISRVSVGTMGPIVDDINVINMPFLFKNTAHANKMMDGPIGQELLDKITASPNANLVALCWMDSGARSLYNTKHAIKAIDHATERLASHLGNPFSDACAAEALGLLDRALRRIKQDTTDLAARLDAQTGTWLSVAGQMSGVPVGAGHPIGRILSFIADAPHGAIRPAPASSRYHR